MTLLRKNFLLLCIATKNFDEKDFSLKYDTKRMPLSYSPMCIIFTIFLLSKNTSSCSSNLEDKKTDLKGSSTLAIPKDIFPVMTPQGVDLETE